MAERPTPEQLKLLIAQIKENPKTSRWHAKMIGRHGYLPGKSCKDCAFLKKCGHGSRDYFKCTASDIGETWSAASDWRAKWPACRNLKPKEETSGA